jgi:subtilase family serine protease
VESNNLRVSALVRVGPDLQVTAFTAPATAAAGDTLTVTDTTKNAGAGAAAATVTSFYLSTNTTWEATDTPIGSRPVSSLPEGVSESVPATVTVPVATAVGTYYILARADAGLNVAESVENNNVRASAAVRVGADLTVTALTAPASAGPGDSITVNETTTNAGGGDAPVSSTAFYLSVNTALDAADTLLGSRPVPELEALAASAAAVPLTVPPGTAVGNYYVIAKADWSGQVNETSETNNTRVSAALKVGPDLTVLTLVGPAAGGAGEPLTVTETVKNLGGGATGVTQSAFFLSANGVLDAADVELGRRPLPALLAGATDVLAVPLTLPPGTAPGNYYIISSVDPDLVVAEVLETNNVKASGVVRVGPDLIVSALTGPTTVVRGATIVLNDTTRNQGGGSAAASTISFYLSTNGTIDAADLLLGTRPVGGLAAGAQESGPTSVVIPASQAAGNYYVIAKADAPGAVAEHLETNNTRAMGLKINP